MSMASTSLVFHKTPPSADDIYIICSNNSELQNSCGYAGTTREEVLPYVRSLRKVSTFSQQISAKSAGTRNKKPILNDIICIFCNLKALIHIILRKI